MAIWHIRKKSAGRKRPRSGHSISDRETSSPRDIVPSDYRDDDIRTPEPPRTPPRRKATLKKRRTEAPRPYSTQQTHEYVDYSHIRPNRYSFTQDCADELRLAASRRSQNNMAHSRAQEPIVWDAPTLSPRWSKKNGKLQKNSLRRDPAREAEIRAMSAMSSISDHRPTSTYSTRSRKVNCKNRCTHSRSCSNDKAKEVDEFPSADSLRSSMSSDGSDAAAYRLTALGFLAPRPTLRYASRPHWSPSADRFPKTQRNIDLPPVAANIRSRARINELADDLDSSDLRTLMERDNRRRERNKIRDQERAAEHIARKKAEHLIAAERSAANGTPPPRNMERGVIGRELLDPLDIFTTVRSGAEMEVSRPMTPESFCSHEAQVESVSHMDDSVFMDIDNVSIEHSASASEIDLATAAHATNDCSSSVASSASSASAEPTQHQELVVPELLPSRSSPAPIVDVQPECQIPNPHASSVSFTPTVSPSIATAMSAEPSSTPPPSSSSFKRRSLRSLLRWGSRKRKHNRQAPPSFTNISRHVMAAEAAKARDLAATATATATAGNAQSSTSQLRDSTEFEVPILTSPTRIVPRRTRSRFREDLPELPISPPASPQRENDLSTIKSISERLSILYSINSSPASKHARHQSIDALNCASPSPSCDAEDEHEEGAEDDEMEQSPVDLGREILHSNSSPEPLSISMASIDSEADWLAGRISPRKIPISRATSRQYADSEWTADAAMSTSMSTAAEDGYLGGYSSHTQHGDEDVIMSSDEEAEEDTTRTVGGGSDMEMEASTSTSDTRAGEDCGEQGSGA